MGKKSNSRFGAFLKRNFLGIAVFVFVVVVFFNGVSSIEKTSRAEGKKAAEDSIRRAVINCYALEGMYPESYEYVRDNYGVRVDEDIYAVKYSIFAANIMPDITVLER